MFSGIVQHYCRDIEITRDKLYIDDWVGESLNVSCIGVEFLASSEKTVTSVRQKKLYTHGVETTQDARNQVPVRGFLGVGTNIIDTISSNKSKQKFYKYETYIHEESNMHIDARYIEFGSMEAFFACKSNLDSGVIAVIRNVYYTELDTIVRFTRAPFNSYHDDLMQYCKVFMFE